LEVVQTITTQYELTAYTLNDLYSTRKKVQVTVIKPVQILYFQPNKDRIIESQKIILTWQVTNAKKVILLPLQKDVTKLNQIELLPTQTGNYCLQASNELFTEEKMYLFMYINYL
jgi:hypothetical protein